MRDRHLILGGSGFIGRHVALLLAQAGHRVTIVGRHQQLNSAPITAQERIFNTVDNINVDITVADWDTLIEDVDVVHHYAWGSVPASANANPGGDLMTNVVSTIGLLEAMKRRGGGRIVFTSSGGTVYGSVKQTPIKEEHAVAPMTAYGAGKATAEIYLAFYRELHNIDCRIARVANPFGAGQDLTKGLGAVSVFLHNALNNEPITIWGDGEIVRDYIHISDAAKCLVKIATTPRHEEYIFNVGSGCGHSLNELVSELECHLGKTLTVRRTEMRSFDVPKSILSIERAAAVLGWSPLLNFSQGIQRTIDDYRVNAQFSNMYPPF